MTVQSQPHVLAIGEALIDVVVTHEQPDFPFEIPGGSPANAAPPRGAPPLKNRKKEELLKYLQFNKIDKYFLYLQMTPMSKLMTPMS